MAIFELFVSYGMIGLFAIGMLSSIIPIPTEPVVLGLLEIRENPELILIVLITGSILGASLGYLAGKYELRRFMIFQDLENERKVQMYFRKYGGLLLLISPWIPIVGDLVPMVAGIENYEPRKFIIVISAAKLIKGIGIVYMSIKVIDWWTLFMK